MKITLADYLSSISRAVVQSAREAVKETLEQAQKADEDLSVEIPIGGVPLKVEGAANLPATVLGMKRLAMKQEAFIETDANGTPHVLLKRGLFAKASKLEIEIDFERSDPLESIEMARDRANEVGKDYVQAHRLAAKVDGKTVQPNKE